MKGFIRQVCSLSDSLHSCRDCCARGSRNARFSGAAKRRVDLLPIFTRLRLRKNNSISPLIPPATQAIPQLFIWVILMTWLSFFRQLNYAKTNMVLWNIKIGKEKWKQIQRMTKKMKRMKKETHLSSKAIIHGTYYNEALLAQAYQEQQRITTRPTNNEIPS